MEWDGKGRGVEGDGRLEYGNVRIAKEEYRVTTGKYSVLNS